ncbi:MAG TPA: hypothetical protein VMB25_18945 [Bryobacteraceae bacterium]|nr:hypothetical protein [Bryobacteraceae bacterium]
MTENERELLEGLRQLAAEGPQQAPGRLEGRLLAEFDRRQRRRRWMVWLPAVSLATAAAAMLLLLAMHRPAVHPAPLVTAVAPAAAVADEDAETTGFYPLPEAEGLPPVESALVVRVQVPVSSLRLMGVPVGEAEAGTDVQADVLLGQDGLARGVRLAQ